MQTVPVQAVGSGSRLRATGQPKRHPGNSQAVPHPPSWRVRIAGHDLPDHRTSADRRCGVSLTSRGHVPRDLRREPRCSQRQQPEGLGDHRCGLPSFDDEASKFVSRASWGRIAPSTSRRCLHRTRTAARGGAALIDGSTCHGGPACGLPLLPGVPTFGVLPTSGEFPGVPPAPSGGVGSPPPGPESPGSGSPGPLGPPHRHVGTGVHVDRRRVAWW